MPFNFDGKNIKYSWISGQSDKICDELFNTLPDLI